MGRPSVVLLPGDGIGPVVLEAAVRALEASGFAADWITADIGWELWVREADPLPARTIELVRRHRLALLGAVTSKPAAQARAELAPHLVGRGANYYSPLVGLRQLLELEVCVRPCRTLAGNPLNYVRRAADGGLIEPALDLVVFRQNTEGFYSGVEWTAPPAEVRAALASHPRFARFLDVPPDDMAVGVRIVTRAASRRILRAAFEHARRHGRGAVTLCEKPNVLRATSGLMLEEAMALCAEFPDVELHPVNVDALMLSLVRSPDRLGVIVASNMFGDIVSDAAAGLVGGLGFVPSANLGTDAAIFEPAHGSAPKYAALDPAIVNPIAAILAGAMLLDHVGESGRATRVRNAVADVVREGQVRTFDMLQLPGGSDAVARGAATTARMTDAIVERITDAEDEA